MPLLGRSPFHKEKQFGASSQVGIFLFQGSYSSIIFLHPSINSHNIPRKTAVLHIKSLLPLPIGRNIYK